MATYSGKHLVFFCLASAVLTFGLVAGFQLLFPASAQQTGQTDSPQTRALPELNLQTSGNLQLSASGASDYNDDEKNNMAVYDALNEAVVNISTEVINYNLFFDPVPQKGSTGSGAIIDKRGFIITNNHVIDGASKLFVTLANGERLEGRLVGRDQENDLAVIQINPGNIELKTINLGNSNSLRVGQKVIAIGNPFSFDRTLTVGIVSGLGRPIRTDSDLIIQNMIQTDASINPGNSGGPLLDSKGNLIGINTMIYSPSGGSIGLGFAVPVDTVRRVVPDLIKFGVVKRGWVDLSPIQLFPELVRYAKLPVERGILVSRIDDNGAAAVAGLRGGERANAVRYGRTLIYLGGDIIVELDGVRTESIGDLYTALEDNKPGDKVRVAYLRGTKKIESTMTLSERPASMNME